MPESWPKTRAGSSFQPLDSGNLYRSTAPLSGPIDTPLLSDRIQVDEEAMPWGSCSPVDIQFQQVDQSPLACDFADSPERFFEHSWPHPRGHFSRLGGDGPWLPTLRKPEVESFRTESFRTEAVRKVPFRTVAFRTVTMQETVPFGSLSYSA